MPCVAAVVDYIQLGLSAADDFSAFAEGGRVPLEGGRAVYSTLLTILNHCHALVSGGLSPAAATQGVSPTQRALILALLRSGNFTKQARGCGVGRIAHKCHRCACPGWGICLGVLLMLLMGYSGSCEARMHSACFLASCCSWRQ
jgi:hypothetical protein